MNQTKKYWFSISIFTLLFVLSAGKVLGEQTSPNRSSPKAGDLNESIPTPESNTKATYLHVGPGLAIKNGNTGWAVNFGALKEVSAGSSLFAGLDFALNFWSISSPNSIAGQPAVNSGATSLQLTPTAIYRFELSGLKGVSPYIGLSMGPNIFMNKAVTVGGNTIQDSSTDVYFEALLRPGIFTNLSDSVALNVEPKFGILKSDFIFLPQASAVFRL